MKFNRAILPAILLAATLTGCKDSSDNKTVEEDHNTGSASRLLVAADGGNAVTAINVRNSEDQTTLTLSDPVTGIYASPASRFGLITQADQVSVIDGGIFQVPHDGHFDTEVEDPAVAGEAFIEEAMVSYRAHEGRGALVAQHSAMEFEVLNFDDHTLEELFEEDHADEADGEHAHEGVRMLDLTREALVEPRGDSLVVVYNSESSAGAADQVEIYHYHEEEGEQPAYEKEDTLSATCSNVQASFSLEHASVFACADGVLVVSEEEHEEEQGKDAPLMATALDKVAVVEKAEEHEHELVAKKIASNRAIDSFTASAHGHVLGAWSGNTLYVIDLEHEDEHKEEASRRALAEVAESADELEAIDWDGNASSEATKVAAAVVAAAEAVVVLDNTGNLHVLTAHEEHDEAGEKKLAQAESADEHEEHGYEYSGVIANVLSNPAANVQMVASPTSDEVFVLDAANKQVVVVHVGEKEIHERINLEFAPAHIAWVGVADGEAGHDHEEDGHDH